MGADLFFRELIFHRKIEFKVDLSLACVLNLRLNCSLSPKAHFIISSIFVLEITLDTLVNAGLLSIANIKNLVPESFKDDFPYEDIIHASSAKNLFHIVGTDLGKAHLLNFPFHEFTIVIQSSNISSINTSTNHVPIAKDQQIYFDLNGRIDGYSLEEIYNQLVLAMQRQGNRTWEIKYYAEYLEWHRKNKLSEFGSLWMLPRYFTKDLSTPASLWLHKVSSGYGNNWVRSAVFTLLGSALLYYFYALSLPEVAFGFDGLTWNYFGHHFKYYTQFILPTHSFQLIPDTDTFGWPAFWDFLGRIVSGFLIYQTIAAFRRFGKR